MHRASTSCGSPFAGIEAGGVSYSIHPLEFCQIPAWVAILPDGASRTDMLWHSPIHWMGTLGYCSQG